MFAAIKLLKPKCPLDLTIVDNNGKAVLGPGEKADRIAEHYTGKFSPTAAEPAVTPFTGTPKPFDKPISTADVASAMSRLKNQRSCGPDDIPAELVKYGGPALAECIFNDVFTQHSQASLGDGVLIALHKPGKPKGPMNNLRPITLLTTARKIFSLITLSRIRADVERYISPSQAGFRQNRSTADIVFCKRILASIVERFNTTIYVLGLDLRKAFDTINRTKLLDDMEQEKIGDADGLRLVRYLLSGKALTVRVNEAQSAPFETAWGVPQGDGLAPVLFKVYLEAAPRMVRDRLPARPSADNILPEETAYADDVDFISTSKSFLTSALPVIAGVFSEWGLTVNTSKTEWIRIYLEPTLGDATSTTSRNVGTTRGKEAWRQVKTLGSLYGSGEDVTHRIGLAARAFGDTLKLWFKHNLRSTPIKIRLYNTFVLPILTYNLACHGLSREQEKRLDVFHRKQLRCTLGITYPDVISNADLYAVTGQCSVSEMAKRDRWKLLGHILRQPSDIPANVALTAFCTYATSQPFRIGAPRFCLTTSFQRDVRLTPICIFKPSCLRDLGTYARDRKQWSNICSAI